MKKLAIKLDVFLTNIWLISWDIEFCIGIKIVNGLEWVKYVKCKISKVV